MGLPGCRSHKNAHQETGCGSAPAPGCVGGGGKGCTVWERLRPSSPLPFLVSVAALGSQPRNVPCLGELSAPVLSPQSGAVTTAPKSRACPIPTVCWPLQHPWTLFSSIPNSCRCHKCTGKGYLAECLPHAIIPIRIPGRGAEWEGSKTSQATA